MADFPDNVVRGVTTADIENVAKRPYREENRPPTGLDDGVTGQWWIHRSSETNVVVGIYQRVGSKWVSYLNGDTKIAGLTLKDGIAVEDLLVTLGVYPLIIGSDPPTTSTKGYETQMYFDIENSVFYVCRGYIGTGFLWEKAFTSSGTGGGVVDLSGYVPISRKIADIDLKDDITVEELQTALGIGDVNTALENIIAIQEALINGNYTKGITFVDEETGKEYKMYVSNEKVTLEEVQQ